MSLHLTFKSKDILNGHLHSDSGHSSPYTTSYSSGMLRRKTTTLQTSGFLSGSAGKIHWRDKTFEIGGRTKKWKKVESSGGGREWEWLGHTYIVKHSHRKWTVTNSGGEVAHFTPYKSHLLRSNEHASLQISAEIQDAHQRAFIILVLLYSETKRQDVRCSYIYSISTYQSPSSWVVSEFQPWSQSFVAGRGINGIFSQSIQLPIYVA
ncbi:hypothetical protein B0H14DRAFT_2409779 [Mycena olivaceomarginata]|nr:hypothetical protein B0H14DRAFT_2409779 [Mycena olivaceomarginata]